MKLTHNFNSEWLQWLRSGYTSGYTTFIHTITLKYNIYTCSHCSHSKNLSTCARTLKNSWSWGRSIFYQIPCMGICISVATVATKVKKQLNSIMRKCLPVATFVATVYTS